MNTTAIPNADVASALREAEELYVAANPNSAAQHRAALAALPGGNTRTAIFYTPFPLFMARGEAQALWDLDGHRYVDYLGEFTAGIYGHSHPVIRAALDEALDGGINFGAQGALEARFAEAIVARFPSIELVRFTNSGTEANLMALVTARAITGRPKVLVFEGAYHGGVFYFRGKPAAINAPFEFVIAPYNDTEATLALIDRHATDLAAIILEPMLGSGGCIPAERGFLEAVRAAATRIGALLVFDEVMTSRLAPGGLQQATGVLPDLTTLGKYIGGGMSFGAFGGRADIMARYDPRRADAFPHAGTFNNNVLTMTAGLAGLTRIYTAEAAASLNARGERLRARLNAATRDRGLAMQFTGLGSMLQVHMRAGALRSAADVAAGDAALRDLFFFDLLARGCWIAKRGMAALSLAITDEDCDALVAAVEDFAATRGSLLG
jgi:glutamate-1-semialdehyde 2,1-aminomutase